MTRCDISALCLSWSPDIVIIIFLDLTFESQRWNSLIHEILKKINVLSNINVSINYVQMPCIYVLNLKSKCHLKQDFKTIKSRHKNLHPLSYFGNFSLDFLWFTLSFFPFREKGGKKNFFPQLCNFGLLELQGFTNMLCLRNFSYCFKMCLCVCVCVFF